MGDLERALIETEQLGDVHVHKLSTGWHACIDLPAPTGCDASVKSDFGCQTPSEAVEQMLSRLHGLRSTFKKIEDNSHAD